MLRLAGLCLLFLAIAVPAVAEKLAKTKDGPPPPFAVEALGKAGKVNEDFDAWKKHITAFDKDRLERLPDAVARGLDEAKANAKPKDLAYVKGLLAAGTLTLTPDTLAKAYRCRTIKVGGPIHSAILYGWFECRIRKMPDGRLFFEKTNGSQRMTGYLYPMDRSKWVLLAAPNENHSGPARDYSGPKGGITDPQKQDQVGVMEWLQDGRYRIVFPYPVLESTFDILELECACSMGE